MMNLKPCPCGKTPKYLIDACRDDEVGMICVPSCCGKWAFASSEDPDDDDNAKRIACRTESWNAETQYLDTFAMLRSDFDRRVKALEDSEK